MNPRLAPLVLAALVLVPRSASALVSIDGFFGLTRPPSSSFSAAVGSAGNNPDLVASSLYMAGADVILHLGALELGVIGDTSFKSGSASQTAIGGLAGIGFDLANSLRLEALGELGAQRYGDFLNDKDVVTASSKEEWFGYVGLRPGLAFKFGGTPGFVVGVWGFVRWDLTTKTVPVTVASASGTSPGDVKLGGATIGAVARVGLDF
jgi:hypothetical protein